MVHWIYADKSLGISHAKIQKSVLVDPIALNLAGSGSRMLAQFGIGFRVMLSVWRKKTTVLIIVFDEKIST